MSITLSEPNKIYRKQFHQRKDSSELQVFEAARYFSGANESPVFNNGAVFAHQCWRNGRSSLDIPMSSTRASIPPQKIEKSIIKDKKYNQPISPGRRLARILNSLFTQKIYSKKKSNPNFNINSTTESVKDENERSSVWGKKRRSSISHFPSIKNVDYSKSIYSSSSTSGYRTPTNLYMDHKPQVVTMKSIASSKNEFYDDKRNREHSVMLEEKFEFNDGFSEDSEFKKLNHEVDDGGDSDSSSDLFELKSHEFGYCYSSSGLPVYETTHLNSIKRGTKNSNGPL